MAKKRGMKSKEQKKAKQDLSPIQGLFLFSSALILLISLLSFAFGKQDARNLLGLLGHSAGWIFHAFFGLSSYFIPLFLGWLGWRMLFHKPIYDLPSKLLFFSLLIISSSTLLNLTEDQFPAFGRALGYFFYPNLWKDRLFYHLGGAPFYFFYKDLPLLNFFHIFNALGTFLIFASAFLISLLFLFKIHPLTILSKLKQLITSLKIEPPLAENELDEIILTPKKGTEFPKEEPDFMRYVKLRIPQTSPNPPIETSGDILAIQPEINPKIRPSISRKEKTEPFLGEAETTAAPMIQEHFQKTTLPQDKLQELQTPSKKKQAALKEQRIYNGDFKEYNPPSATLLTPAKKIDQSSLKKDLKRQAEVLEETLLSFGIEAKVGQINCGPTITSFEVHPAIGVKVQKIKTLENDIALNMEAKSIRIIAPIPGKAAVGIEVPNASPQEVGFKDMLQAYQQGPKKFHIPILLGKAVNGDYVMSDLAKMPHCIIAGATGSGKSVCINTIIMSILLNAKPDEIKLVMVDPKKVELTPYSKLPHMLAPVITEPSGACAALNWLVKEMEKRYEIFKLVGCRNIEAFNTRTINKELEESLEREIPEKLPFIVGIIDELADLMMVASSDIETPIARIAQMARAVGIHLILATQRPSREVITGLIKANFPTRISFKVASRVNSQIVLDEVGAETLLGNGDMLFLPPGSSHLVRAQGAFIRDEDINAIVKHICEQAPPNYAIESFDHLSRISTEDDLDEEPTDALYDQALDIVLSTGNASTTFLQRKLKIGYARAASLMDQLEMRGIVGPAEGSKPRKILSQKKAQAQSQTEDELIEDEILELLD